MRVTRRNVLIVLGIMTVAGGALFGAGAFSTVEADRTVALETTGDGSALLALEDGGSALVDMNDNQLEISNTSLNQDAKTIANGSIDVTNNGENGVGLYVNATSPAFDIHDSDGNSIEGATGSIDVAPGATESLTLVVDLTGDNAEGDLPSGVQFVADTSEYGGP